MTVIEKPDEESISKLFEKYEEPVIREIQWDLTQLDQSFEKPECIGEGVPVIFDDKDRIAMIRHTGPKNIDYWMLPMGRIEFGETVEQGTIREAKEETGLDIKLVTMPAIHKIIINFKNFQLIRWHFIFKAKIIGGSPEPINKNEIAEVSFFKPIPNFSNWGEVDKEWIPLAISDVMKQVKGE